MSSKPRKICLINYKGGTGKTSTTVNLAHGLAQEGQRVLVIDTDPQGSSSFYLNSENNYTLFDLLVKDIDPKLCITKARENLDIICSNERLYPAELQMAKMKNRNKILSKKLERLENNYDFILIDCAPSLNLLNQNALQYCNEIFLPVSMDVLSLVGVKQLLTNVKVLNTISNHQIKISKVIPTFYDNRNKKTKQVYNSINRVFPDVISSPIRTCVSISESAGYKKTIFEFAPKSKGATDYRQLTKEVI